jgi:hypothetical protein
VLSEPSHHPLSSRYGQKRTDVVHQPLDPVIVGGPWVVAGGLAYVGARAVRRALARSTAG